MNRRTDNGFRSRRSNFNDDRYTPPIESDRDSPPPRRVQNSPPARRVQNSPPARRVQNSPPTRRVQNSPPVRGVQNSPPARRVQNSPPTRRVQNSPPARGVQNSPPTRRVQNSPPTRRVQNSPPLGPARHSPPIPVRRHEVQPINDEKSTRNNISSPIPLPAPSVPKKVEVFYIEAKDDDRQETRPTMYGSPVPFDNNDRLSPMKDPYIEPMHPNGDHLVPFAPIPPLNDDLAEFHDRKVETYILDVSLTDGPMRRTPSPTIQSARSMTAFSEDNHRTQPPKKSVVFPTALATIPSPNSESTVIHSRASESIGRSMNKYRFLGS